MSNLTIDQIADLIYSLVYGNPDDKRHRTKVQTEIRDWLKDGDLTPPYNVKALADEWKERELAAAEVE